MESKDQAFIGAWPTERETLELLTDLQRLVRAAGHGKPSKGLLTSALIYAAPRDGDTLYRDFIAPYRRSQPDED